jgi:hypothetical protein
MRPGFALPVLVAVLALASTAREARASIVFDVKVGYADGLRAGGFFPNPWGGDPGVIFDGRTPTGVFDDGAIRIDNKGTSPFTISNVVVDSFENGAASFALWGTHVVNPGEILILTATSGDNFDTSDLPIHEGPADGGYASTAKPRIRFDLNGNPQTVIDSGQILNTGGFDLGTHNGRFNTNESLGWRDIGTTGIADPAGDQAAPEPASLALFGLTTLAGAGYFGWRRRKKAVPA